MEYTVELSKILEKLELENFTPQVPLEGRVIKTTEINRPALQLTGYYTYFDPERIQVMGKVEYSYLSSLSRQQRYAIFDKLFSTGIPCLIICRGLLDPEADKELLDLAVEHAVPLLSTKDTTTTFTAKLVEFLHMELAPRIAMHGVMVDCFGEGVLILGESGLGKSETALELVQRGHRLVADDVVEIRKISETELMAQGAELIQNLIELRGVGIINVKELYGVQAVRLNKTIDMVVKLETWSPDKQYDRMGLEKETIEILGNKVVCYSIPIMVGRNVSMIIESAALNHRQKKMGYNAAEELRDRVNAKLNMRRQQS